MSFETTGEQGSDASRVVPSEELSNDAGAFEQADSSESNMKTITAKDNQSQYPHAWDTARAYPGVRIPCPNCLCHTISETRTKLATQKEIKKETTWPRTALYIHFSTSPRAANGLGRQSN